MTCVHVFEPSISSTTTHTYTHTHTHHAHTQRHNHPPTYTWEMSPQQANTQTHRHTDTHARTHARTHAHTDTHITHTHLELAQPMSRLKEAQMRSPSPRPIVFTMGTTVIFPETGM